MEIFSTEFQTGFSLFVVQIREKSLRAYTKIESGKWSLEEKKEKKEGEKA